MKTKSKTTKDAALRNGTKRPVMPIPPDQFPHTGMVSLRELSSHNDQKGFFPMSPDKWMKLVDEGTAPPPVKLGRQYHWHALHVRAVAAGLNWREVDLGLPPMKSDTKTIAAAVAMAATGSEP